MVSKKYWGKVTDAFLTLLRQVKQVETASLLDVSFQVLPGVFSPIYSSDTIWFAQQLLPLVKEKTFLEIGAGTGAIACLASLHGARQVVATDINPTAIENTRLNAQLHSLEISVREGSVFDPIAPNERFDLIFWNHPFYAHETSHTNDMLTASMSDIGYRSLTDFFRRGKAYLAPKGQLLLGSSNIAGLRFIKQLAKQEDYICTLLSKCEVPVHSETKIRMDLRVYAFSQKTH